MCPPHKEKKMNKINLNSDGSMDIGKGIETKEWDAFRSMCADWGMSNMADIAEVYALTKQDGDDEYVEYQDKLIDTTNPELIMELKEEASFIEVKVEEVFETKAKAIDPSLVYSTEQGEVKECKASRNEFVRMNARELANAKRQLGQELKARRVKLEGIIAKLDTKRKQSIEDQAKATGVDPVILARVLKSQENKVRCYARRMRLR